MERPRADREESLFQWMPIRDDPTAASSAPSLRRLLDLIMLDTRLWARDRPAAGSQDKDIINDPDRDSRFRSGAVAGR
jgi:phosphodiesterase/alkaline phosphatase D-like protein